MAFPGGTSWIFPLRVPAGSTIDAEFTDIKLDPKGSLLSG